MIDLSLTPTHLAAARVRRPVEIREPARPRRWRGLQVSWALVRLGLRVLVQLLLRHTAHQFGVELRRFFERLGGAWLRAGALLSLRIDIFPAEVCEELATLQARRSGSRPPTPAGSSRRSLAAPIERYFDEFEEVPFAVAPISQVHRARLRQEQQLRRGQDSAATHR